MIHLMFDKTLKNLRLINFVHGLEISLPAGNDIDDNIIETI